MLHTILFRHPMMSRLGFGVVHMCVNRFSGRINGAVWYPEGYKERVPLDGIDWPAFMNCSTVNEGWSIVNAANEGL